MYRNAIFSVVLLAVTTVAVALAGARNQPLPTAANNPLSDDSTAGGAGATIDASAFPAVLEKLQLSEDQQSQVRQVQKKYNSELDGIWKQFTGRYLETISLEATLLAAIEDGLTDVQRAHVRKQRAHTAHSERQSARRDLKDGLEDRKTRPDEKPSDAVDEELVIVGITLTPEQERAADKVQAGYFHRLRDLKREIHRLHTRLLSVEADKLVEIEKILTKEQLTQLRHERQAPAGDLKRAGSDQNETLKK